MLERKEKVDDVSKFYVEVYNLPEHGNKEDIVFFLWKALEKCRALIKHTNPVSPYPSRSHRQTWCRNWAASVSSSAPVKRHSIASISTASCTYQRCHAGRETLLYEEPTRQPHHPAG